MALPGSLERLRAANRRSILHLMTNGGPTSRADLARGTGLSRTTVSSLVAELISSGHVTETTDRGRPHKGGSGRPPVLLRLSAPSGCVAGVDIGHGHIRIAIANRTGEVLTEDHAEVDVDAQGVESLDLAARLVGDGLATAGRARHELQAVGMCVPAPVDRRSAQISTDILPGWKDLAPNEELGRRLDVPVFADNDANLGALAELNRGAAHSMLDLVYVKLASGLGAGMVLGGRLHRGATGIAGELGHVRTPSRSNEEAQER